MTKTEAQIKMAERDGWIVAIEPMNGYRCLTITKDGFGSCTGRLEQIEAIMASVKMPDYLTSFDSFLPLLAKMTSEEWDKFGDGLMLDDLKQQVFTYGRTVKAILTCPLSTLITRYCLTVGIIKEGERIED